MSTPTAPDRCRDCQYYAGDFGCERGAASDEDCPLNEECPKETGRLGDDRPFCTLNDEVCLREGGEPCATFDRSVCLLAPACQEKTCDDCYIAKGIKEMEHAGNDPRCEEINCACGIAQALQSPKAT